MELPRYNDGNHAPHMAGRDLVTASEKRPDLGKNPALDKPGEVEARRPNKLSFAATTVGRIHPGASRHAWDGARTGCGLADGACISRRALVPVQVNDGFF